MTSQGGRSCVVGVQRPDWLLSGTLLMDNSISLFFLICHNFEIQVIFFVVTHDRGLVQRPDWLLSGTLFMDHNAAKCITLCLNMSQG